MVAFCNVKQFVSRLNIRMRLINFCHVFPHNDFMMHRNSGFPTNGLRLIGFSMNRRLITAFLYDKMTLASLF